GPRCTSAYGHGQERSPTGWVILARQNVLSRGVQSCGWCWFRRRWRSRAGRWRRQERSGSAGRPAGACPWPPASARSASAALRISGAENWNGACFIMKQIRLFVQLFVGHHTRMKLSFAVAALLFALSAPAQQAPVPAPSAADQALVEFNFEWNQGIPWQSYSIQVQADGKTHFAGTPNPSQGADDDPVQQDFIMSDANQQKTFDLAKKLNYFRGDFDSHLKHIAQTGAKTLAYKSAQVQGSSTYNYSQNPDVQQLTQLFLGLANTLDFGRKLTFQYRFDKLGMDQLLRELEEQQASHQVEELSAIEPILRKVANDPNLMHITCQSAQHLLKTIDVAGA